MSEVKTAPLTDEEVARLSYVVGLALGNGSRDAMVAGHRLVDEVRRLRALHYDQVLDDIGTLREAVGLPNCALPISPQKAMGEAIEVARRLREDAWVNAAAEDIYNAAAQYMDGTCDLNGPEDVAKIIREHRDGTA